MTTPLPYKILADALVDKMPDIELEPFSNDPYQGGWYMRFDDLAPQYIIVSGNDGGGLFQWDDPLNLNMLTAEGIQLHAYLDEDGQLSDTLINDRRNVMFLTAIERIVSAVGEWVMQAREKRDRLANIKSNDDKFFPFKGEFFGGCEHSGYVNTASVEAAHDIMNSLLKLGEEGPGTKLTEAFGSDEPVGDQLQALLMAAYQMALKDIATGNLSLTKVLHAARELDLLNAEAVSEDLRQNRPARPPVEMFELDFNKLPQFLKDLITKPL